MDHTEYIEKNTLRLEASRRGGGIEIDCSELFNIDDAKMSAYQNYLGGGIAGAIKSNANFTPNKKDKKKYLQLSEDLKKYFFNVTNEEVEEFDEWAADANYESNQLKPESAY